jgi:hypothetical protein
MRENVIEEFLETSGASGVRLAEIGIPELVFFGKSVLYREVLEFIMNGRSSAPAVAGVDSKRFTNELRISIVSSSVIFQGG